MRSPCPRKSRGAPGEPSNGCWLLADPLGLVEVRRALAEDRAAEDVTTGLLGPLAEAAVTARFAAEGRFGAAGRPIAQLAVRTLAPGARPDSVDGEGAATTPERTFAPLREQCRAARGW